jgi:phosphoribosylformylglycinamidine synthase subunit PurSL
MNSYLIEVSRKAPESDPAGERLLKTARASGVAVEAIRLASVYELGPVTEADAEALASGLLKDHALDTARVAKADSPDGAASPTGDEAVLTVLRRDGVMDPVALSTVIAAKELGIELTQVRTARRVYCKGSDGPPSAESLGPLQATLGNPVVDRVLVGSVPFPKAAATATGDPVLTRDVPLAELGDAELLALSKSRTLALDVAEMTTIKAHFAALGRAPRELELETLAQTWSEHCKHKSLTQPIDFQILDAEGEQVSRETINNLLKDTIFASTQELNLDRCLSVFVDNAGVIRFDETQGVAIKVETHNHPSALEPYGGSGTGIGGVIRDILGTGLGARPIFNIDVFCVGDLDTDDTPPGTLSPLRVLSGIVSGVRDYGNRMGIPTVSGALISEPRYVGNPLVYAGTVGLIPNTRIEKKPRPGDWIVAVGGRTGRDGIHGATFSSDALHSESETQSGGAVQIGNPIEEKKFSDVLLAVRDKGWMSALTDCGAGGFSSAVGEMAEGLGARVDLSNAPLKYEGLEPWEVWISEAQERMVLAVPPEHGPSVLEAFAAEDVEAIDLGRFTGDGMLVVTWGETVVGELSLDFMHDGLPKQTRTALWKRPAAQPLAWPDAASTDLGELLEAILGTTTVCSKEWIIRQYDHEVQGASALKPMVGVQADGPSDAAAVAPVPGSPRGVLVGLGVNPRYCDGDPYQMAACSIDEALRNVVATGADIDQSAILDNFSWGDCRRPEQLGSLVRAAQACQDMALAYKVPFISGKDSLNNEYQLPSGERVAIPGTLLITAVAVTPDVSKLVSMDLKGAGHSVLIVGETRDELLGSMLCDVTRASGGSAPTVDLKTAPAVHRAMHAAMQTGAVLACHDLSEGGLAVAAAESAFAGEVGLTLDLATVPGAGELDARSLLFSETPTRWILEVETGQVDAVKAALGSTPHAVIGETTQEQILRVTHQGATVLERELAGLKSAWREPLGKRFE